MPWANFGPPVLSASGAAGVAARLAEPATDVDGDGVRDIRIGYAGPSFIEPSTGNQVFAPSLATRTDAAVFSARSMSNVRSALRSVTPPAFTSSATAAALDARNWGNLHGINNGVVDSDIEYPIGNGAYPIVGFTYGLFYTCYADSNVRDALGLGVKASSLATFLTSSTPDAENLFRNGSLLRPQAYTDDADPANNLREAVRTLLLIDNRTKLRAGTRPVGDPNLPMGCNTGA